MDDRNRTGHETARRYAAAEMTGIDRERLLMLLLDGGGRFLRVAREALAGGDRAGFGQALSRAQAIIAELQGTLDHQVGGEIAANLHRLYDFMLFHLTEANGQGSVRHLDKEACMGIDPVDLFHRTLQCGWLGPIVLSAEGMMGGQWNAYRRGHGQRKYDERMLQLQFASRSFCRHYLVSAPT